MAQSNKALIATYRLALVRNSSSQCVDHHIVDFLLLCPRGLQVLHHVVLLGDLLLVQGLQFVDLVVLLP